MTMNYGGESGLVPGGNTMQPDELRCVEMLATGAPLDEIAAATGWSMDKVRRVARSSKVIAAVASINVTMLHATEVPRAIRTISNIMSGFLEWTEYEENSSSDPTNMNPAHKARRVVRERVKPEMRLAAAQTFLKMGGYDKPPEVKNPNDIKDLSEMRPDELRALVGTLEAELGARAAPVSAPVDDAEIVDDAESIAKSML